MGVVAIVGRPNVGKSTLFNRFVGGRNAITSDVSGTTRDRHYGKCVWDGITFDVVDTGGYLENDCKKKIVLEINQQVNIAIKEAGIILFLVDAKEGLVDEDVEFAKMLRKKYSKKKIFLVVNKVDCSKKVGYEYEFLKLGFENVFFVSAVHGCKTEELFDEVAKVFKNTKNDCCGSKILPRFLILGKPNVGKSSLMNVLIKEARSIVDDVAGTTRDPVDAVYNLYGKEFILIDTAGIRKKSAKKDDLEFYSTLRAIQMIEKCDVCLYVFDSVIGLGSEDLKLINCCARRGKGIVLAANKWDLVKDDQKTAQNFKLEVRNKLKDNNFCPIVLISALEKTNLSQLVQKCFDVYSAKEVKIKTSELNKFLGEVIKNKVPYSKTKGEIKIKYVTQLQGSKIVSFVFFCNKPKDINENYKKFLRNELYKNFKLEGVPIKLFFREK